MRMEGIHTALITPFVADGTTIAFDRLRQQIEYQAAHGVTSVVPSGTTGEAPTLSGEEWDELIGETVRCARAHGLQVIAGAGSNNTEHAIALHRHAAQSGADASLQVCPYYIRPSQEGLYRHFSAIADSCDLPVVLYNVPSRASSSISIETLTRLDRHPNIVAIKEATGDLHVTCNIIASTDLDVLCGDDPLTLPCVSVGAIGSVSVMSNLVPQESSELVVAALKGDLATARRIHTRLWDLASGLMHLGPNPAPVKWAMRCLGRDSGTLRLPLTPPEADSRRAIERLVRRIVSPPVELAI